MSSLVFTVLPQTSNFVIL